MSTFRPFDYLDQQEQQEVLKYEHQLQVSRTVSEYLEINRIIDDYLELARVRKRIAEIKDELRAKGKLDEDN
ncbi:hypothetical protein LYSIN_01209 [Lysinibacillus sphaericus]|uniref:Uncharacterized protein n=1 Tax=Lysinibacillus sphaericus TaxID=1421 RepID=A0A2S5D042_LYSSH|nr:hypothetical protein [Lysinibacillus sphaericus]POZ56426.1 hypothetical protein LYSIN_01209 [Lysinibacillus sphaericus]